MKTLRNVLKPAQQLRAEYPFLTTIAMMATGLGALTYLAGHPPANNAACAWAKDPAQHAQCEKALLTPKP